MSIKLKIQNANVIIISDQIDLLVNYFSYVVKHCYPLRLKFTWYKKLNDFIELSFHCKPAS